MIKRTNFKVAIVKPLGPKIYPLCSLKNNSKSVGCHSINAPHRYLHCTNSYTINSTILILYRDGDRCSYKTFTRLPFGVSNSEQHAHSFAPSTYI